MNFEQITVSEVALAIIALSTAWNAYTNIKGKWRTWLHREMRDVRTSLTHVEDQLKPNGGSSLVDKVNRLEVGMRDMAKDMASIKRKVEEK